MRHLRFDVRALGLLFYISFGSGLTLFLAGGLACAQKVTKEEVVTKHLESIGSGPAVGHIRNRLIVGVVVVTFVSQRNQRAEGRVVFASEKEKNYFGTKLNASDYSGEQFRFDGANSAIGYANLGTRTVLGNFVQSNNWMVADSIFGGVLASSWVLMRNADVAKLSFDGVKKVGGKDAYVLAYSRKGGSDVDVRLYFDKETYRHVRTEYKRTSSAGIGTSPDQSSGFSETRIKLTEDFSDFRDESGLTLPHRYRITYGVTGQRGTTELLWDHVLSNFLFNQNLDASTFSPADK